MVKRTDNNDDLAPDDDFGFEVPLETPWKLGDPYPDDWVQHDWLSLAEGNPRRGDIERIRESIETNGWFGRIVVQRHCAKQGGRPRIIFGNHRFRAGRELGMEKFPVTWYDIDDQTAD